MIEPTTLARPYARAAFEHARAAGDLVAWQAALSELAAITAEPKVAAAMRDPNQTAAQRAATLSGLAGDAVTSAVANLLAIMADNGDPSEEMDLVDKLKDKYKMNDWDHKLLADLTNPSSSNPVNFSKTQLHSFPRQNCHHVAPRRHPAAGECDPRQRRAFQI